MVGEALPLAPGSAILPAASWPLPPSLARCPVSGPVEGTVLALPIGSGRARRGCEWRGPAGCPRPPFPEAPYQAMHQQFPSAPVQGVGPDHCSAPSTVAKLSAVSRRGRDRWESKEGTLTLRATSLRAGGPHSDSQQPLSDLFSKRGSSSAKEGFCIRTIPKFFEVCLNFEPQNSLVLNNLLPWLRKVWPRTKSKVSPS